MKTENNPYRAQFSPGSENLGKLSVTIQNARHTMLGRAGITDVIRYPLL